MTTHKMQVVSHAVPVYFL